MKEGFTSKVTFQIIYVTEKIVATKTAKHPKSSAATQSHPTETIWNTPEPSATTRNHPQPVRI